MSSDRLSPCSAAQGQSFLEDRAPQREGGCDLCKRPESHTAGGALLHTLPRHLSCSLCGTEARQKQHLSLLLLATWPLMIKELRMGVSTKIFGEKHMFLTQSTFLSLCWGPSASLSTSLSPVAVPGHLRRPRILLGLPQRA